MSKAAGTFSNNSQPSWSKRRRPAAKNTRRAGGKNKKPLVPGWIPYAAAAGMTLMLCLTINFRAYTELNEEVTQHETLNTQIESLTSENLSLQEEIHYLKNDSAVIEREARKFGFGTPAKKVPVQAAK